MPYSEVTVTGYNANPPPDDGSQVAANEVAWQKHLDKIGDPLRVAIEQTQANITTIVDALELADLPDPVPIANGGTGQITAAAAFTALKQAASDTATGVVELADQSEMEAASDTTRAVVPGRVHFHPDVAKCWAFVTYSGGTPTLEISSNITSITDTALGKLTITIATDFSSSSWPSLATAKEGSAGGSLAQESLKAAGTIEISVKYPVNNSLQDPATINFVGFGDQV